jgi:hypothetical protein
MLQLFFDEDIKQIIPQIFRNAFNNQFIVKSLRQCFKLKVHKFDNDITSVIVGFIPLHECEVQG